MLEEQKSGTKRITRIKDFEPKTLNNERFSKLYNVAYRGYIMLPNDPYRELKM